MEPSASADSPADPLSASRFAATVEEWGGTVAGRDRLVALLDEQHPAYEERSALDTVWMRGWILVALSRHELPSGALPFLLEELDTSMVPYLVAAAARALRFHPTPSPEFAPFLLRALKNMQDRDEPVGFAHYAEYEPAADGSSAVRELLLTIQWLGPRARALEPELQGLRENRVFSPRLEAEVARTVAALHGPVGATGRAEADCCALLRNVGRLSWISSRRGSMDSIGDTVFEDQGGAKTTFAEFFGGHPSIVAFFYTRCDNPLKCSLTIWKLARVQQLLEERGLAGRIHTAAISYDPEFDQPERLRTYGQNRRLRMDGQHRLLRAVNGLAPLRAYFKLGVSFLDRLVSRHRIELYLLDTRGRIAASYQRIHWSETDVAEQAAALLDDRSHRPPAPRKVSPLAAFLGPAAAVLVAFLPKCPVCWAAYLSAFGLTAFAGVGYSRGFQALAVVLILVSLGSVFLRALTTRRWIPFGFTLAGTVATILQLWLDLAQILPVGISCLVLGSLFSSFGRPRKFYGKTLSLDEPAVASR